MARKTNRKKPSTRGGGRSRSVISARFVAGISIAVVLVAGAFLLLTDAFVKREAVASVTVYKSATCGCCAKWVDHMEDNGFDVEVLNRSDVTPYKQEFGVPPRLYSCHTAVVNDYVIEGHVPADDIKRLLTEKPRVKGLAVPGMPQGSPGMETGRVDHYRVMTFDANQDTRTFSRY